MRKSIVLVIVSICIAFSMSIPTVAFASVTPASTGGGVIQPFWANVSDITLSMSYSGGTVNWRGIVQGKSNTASISATYKLERLNSSGKYESVDSWISSTKSTKMDSSASKTGTKGTYRLTVTAIVKSTSGVAETVTDSLVKTL